LLAHRRSVEVPRARAGRPRNGFVTPEVMISARPAEVEDRAIFTDAGAAKSLFTGALVMGPKTITYQVPALPSGTYYFRCDVHPTQMFGTFVVK
jgi:hypothetical protein